MNIWFTSDTHFGHVNICRGASNWMQRIANEGREPTKAEIAEFHRQTRDFKTVEGMNRAIIDNINSCVKEDDILYHLGDFAMGSHENIARFRNSLKCQTIHLILGNHDQHIVKKPEYQELFTSINTTLGWPDVKKSKIGGTRFLLCHFPMLVWDKHMHGSIHLHGHSHGSLKNEQFYKRKVMDVGIDAHPEFRPFHIDEIKRIMDKRKIAVVDHHTSKTAQ